jgi:hypothetical protein
VHAELVDVLLHGPVPVSIGRLPGHRSRVEVTVREVQHLPAAVERRSLGCEPVDLHVPRVAGRGQLEQELLGPEHGGEQHVERPDPVDRPRGARRRKFDDAGQQDRIDPGRRRG